MNYYTMLLIICPLVFFAGFIDSVAGGGGLISSPAYMLAGLPMHNVLGTNKVMSTIGTSVAAARYIKSGKIQWSSAIISSATGFLGSFLGSQIALMTDQLILKKIFVLALPFIAAFVLFNKNSKEGVQKIFGNKMYIACGIIGIVIGLYDGIIGPGTGTFLIFAYTSVIGFDYITASGNAKIVNLSSNMAAAASYIIAGKVIWAIAIPAALANLIGNYLGSGYAIKNGSKVVKKMLIFVLIGIFFKLVIDII
ncbi:MAG: TSUP family transporter [Oscillospiraceae bacterium]